MRKTMTALITFFTIVMIAFPFQVDIQKRAFTDFEEFTNDYENVLNQVKRVHQLIGAIEALKTEILEDTARPIVIATSAPVGDPLKRSRAYSSAAS